MKLRKTKTAAMGMKTRAQIARFHLITLVPSRGPRGSMLKAARRTFTLTPT